MPVRQQLACLRSGAVSLVRDAGTRDAAQLAYFLVMSFPAAMLLLVWAFSVALGDDSVRESIVDSIVAALPLADPADRRQIEALLEDVAAGAGSLGWLGAIALLGSASGAIGSLRYAVNEARHEPDSRPYAKGKALDAALTLLVAPTVMIGLGLNLSGSLADAIGDHPWLFAAAQFVVTEVVPVVLLLGLLVILFRVLPAAHVPLRGAFTGALAATVGVVLVQVGAEAYFSGIGDKSAVYGTLGVLLAVVFSAYLDAIAIVYGAHVAARASALPGA